MEILELLELVNKELEDGKSLTAIGREIGVSESTIRKRLNRQGYKRVGKKFILQDVGQDDRQEVRHQIITNKPQDQNKIIVTEQQEQFKKLMSNYDTLMEIIEHYKNAKVVPGDSNIIIELPHEEDKKAKYTLRLNDVVFKQFQAFCSEHKQFTQKELMSMALLEYIKNHS